jgi:prepilin-type processing-associated H-X9-DG protein
MVVEAAQSVPWTKPEELPYDPAKPVPKLGGFFSGGFNAAYMDGSVHFFSKVPELNILRALITHQGGEVIPRLDE